MSRLTENKIVLITRKTRLDELIRRFNTRDQARFYIEHLGGDFRDYQREDRIYKEQLDLARGILTGLGRLQEVDRGFIPNFVFQEKDTIIVLGQDGLVANTLKYLNQQQVLGVNPDPDRWEGILLPFTVSQLKMVLPQLFAGKRTIRTVTMAKAELNNGQILYGVNDIFIGPKTHTSARYRIEHQGRIENHSSSGIIVSTGLGSTGWLRSIFAETSGIASYLSGQELNFLNQEPVSWGADYLYFSVREPWPSNTSAAGITFGKITAQESLLLESHMPENGVIFSDGMEEDYLEFHSGTTAVISLADKVGHLVG